MRLFSFANAREILTAPPVTRLQPLTTYTFDGHVITRRDGSRFTEVPYWQAVEKVKFYAVKSWECTEAGDQSAAARMATLHQELAEACEAYLNAHGSPKPPPEAA